MGRDLLATCEVFRKSIERCQEAFDPFISMSLVDLLSAVGDVADAEPMPVEVLQPLLFSVMVSLADVWAAYGVRPDAVAGHSQGEVAAACVAGALPLAEAARIVAVRSRALSAVDGRGAMVSVPLPESEVLAVLDEAGLADRLSVAAVNSPATVTVAGEPDAVEDLIGLLTTSRPGTTCHRVRGVGVASHCPLIESLRDPVMAGRRPGRQRWYPCTPP
jgi:acyl transferase domain-containing protein